MSVENESTPKEVYSGNGATTAFDVGFRVLDETHLRVETKIVATGVVSGKTITTDYSVVVDDEGDGATVTMVVAPPIGTDLYITSNAPQTQDVEIEYDGPLPPETLVGALDKLTLITKQMQEELDRCVKFSRTSDDIGASVVSPNEGKGLIWDEDGNLVNTEANVNDSLALALEAQEAAEDAQAAAETAQAAAEASETAADASESASAVSAAIALAAQLEAETAADIATAAAAAVVFAAQTSHALTAGAAAADIDGRTFDGAAMSSVMLDYEIVRGTTIHAQGTLTLFYKAATWVLVDTYTEPGGNEHGITWSINQTTSVAQLRAAANGGDNAAIKLVARRFTV